MSLSSLLLLDLQVSDCTYDRLNMMPLSGQPVHPSTVWDHCYSSKSLAGQAYRGSGSKPPLLILQFPALGSSLTSEMLSHLSANSVSWAVWGTSPTQRPYPQGLIFCPPQQPQRRKHQGLIQLVTFPLNWTKWGRAQHWQSPLP